jgi:hypothetical protein
VDCRNCHSTQSSLQFACAQCQQRLYANMEEDELAKIAAMVERMEALLDGWVSPQGTSGSPYEPMDKAWATYRSLKSHHYLPGMPAYLDRTLEILLPVKLHLMKRTVRANWIFLGVMLLFPLVTAITGMGATVTGLLALPAVAWTFVVVKALKDLKRTQQRITQPTAS